METYWLSRNITHKVEQEMLYAVELQDQLRSLTISVSRKCPAQLLPLNNFKFTALMLLVSLKKLKQFAVNE
jgi:hypothetical protein